MVDQTEIEVVSEALKGWAYIRPTDRNIIASCIVATLDIYRKNTCSASLPDEVRETIEWLRMVKSPYAYQTVRLIETEHAARVKAEAELAEALAAIRDAAATDETGDEALDRCHRAWADKHAAALAKAAEQTAKS